MAEQNDGGPLVQLALTVASLAEQVARLTEAQCKMNLALQSLASQMDEEGEDEPVETYLSGKPK